MPAHKAEFDQRIAELKARLVVQGRAVQRAIEGCVDAAFERDQGKARAVVESDSSIDKEDVVIERLAVTLLAEAAGAGAALSETDARTVLVIVKVNNEFERIADCAAKVAERVPMLAASASVIPPKFRVMANSVIGIMQTTNTALSHLDRVAAEVVLASDDATDAFTRALLEDTLRQLAGGQLTLALAEVLQSVAWNLGQMADHCSNVAEQVIYLTTGKIVRHQEDRWSKPIDVG